MADMNQPHMQSGIPTQPLEGLRMLGYAPSRDHLPLAAHEDKQRCWQVHQLADKADRRMGSNKLCVTSAWRLEKPLSGTYGAV